MNLPPIVDRLQVRQHIGYARTMARDLALSRLRRGQGHGPIFQHHLYADRSAYNAIVAFRRRAPITTTATTTK